MRKLYIIRQIIVSLMVFLLLSWAFFKNQLLARVAIIPFLVCSMAIFWENIFYLLQKDKIANIFKFIFRISFFVYFFGFLIFAIYYSLTNKSYSLLIIIGIFLFWGIRMFKGYFFKNKK